MAKIKTEGGKDLLCYFGLCTKPADDIWQTPVVIDGKMNTLVFCSMSCQMRYLHSIGEM